MKVASFECLSELWELRSLYLTNIRSLDGSLRDNLHGTVERGAEVTRFSITDMDEEFTVKAERLVRICDAIVQLPFHLQGFSAIQS